MSVVLLLVSWADAEDEVFVFDRWPRLELCAGPKTAIGPGKKFKKKKKTEEKKKKNRVETGTGSELHRRNDTAAVLLKQSQKRTMRLSVLPYVHRSEHRIKHAEMIVEIIFSISQLDDFFLFLF